MTLEQRLPSGAGAKEVHAVTLPPLPGEPAPPPGSEGGAGGSGSLYVYGDSGGAVDQFDSCRQAAGPLCFRASNIVVVLSEDSSQIEVRRLAVAMQKLAE
jgi:hypothetical protein